MSKWLEMANRKSTLPLQPGGLLVPMSGVVPRSHCVPVLELVDATEVLSGVTDPPDVLSDPEVCPVLVDPCVVSTGAVTANVVASGEGGAQAPTARPSSPASMR